MKRAHKSVVWALLTGLGLALASTVGWADSSVPHGEKPVFKHKNASTIKTIPFKRMDSRALSNTAIEGGLVEPADSRPSKPGKQYVTSDQARDQGLTLEQMKNTLLPAQERDHTVEFQFSPDVTFGDVRRLHHYNIQLPSNRTYYQANYNTTQH